MTRQRTLTAASQMLLLLSVCALPTRAQMAPVQMAPVQVAPMQVAPVQMAPVQMAPVQMAPVQMAPARTYRPGVVSAPATDQPAGMVTQLSLPAQWADGAADVLRPRVRPPNHDLVQGATLLSGGVLSFGVILLLPEDISKWRRDEGFAPGWSNVRRAFTQPPVWDEDEWHVNFVGHPLVGMHTYLTERNFDASPLRAFLFSTAASVGWEYFIESWAEQPSVQDLIFTSTIGSVLGELNHQASRQLRRGGLSGWQKVVLTVINPHDVLHHGYR
jgi:hypothetical protein